MTSSPASSGGRGPGSAVLFTSTRDPLRSPTGFVQALRRGLAEDGGLYVPLTIPKLPGDWDSASSFVDLATSVLATWIDGGASRDAAVRDALSLEVPLVALSGAWEGVHVLELFHGPTFSFKDFGARCMARFLAASEDRSEPVTVLVATSGDTGSAVADGFSGTAGARVVLLYPEGQVSPVQERQLIVQRPGVTALRVCGTFDDCQRMVKQAFADPALGGIRLSSANSINIGRLLPQMLYYIWAGARLGQPYDVCIPSGNLGNLTAAVLAHLSGLPLTGFLAAHNANRFFPEYLQGVDARPGSSIRTISNAMDVGAPSNFERLEWLLGREGLRSKIRGYSVSDEDTTRSMRRVYEDTGYVADPHTAVGLEAVRIQRARGGRNAPVVVAATAHPAKFPEAVRGALGFDVPIPPALAELWDRPVRVQGIDATAEALRSMLLSRPDQ
jgi:threonine synthase